MMELAKYKERDILTYEGQTSIFYLIINVVLE